MSTHISHAEMIARYAEMEKKAVASVISFAQQNKELLQYIAHWGDGNGGHITAIILGELGMAQNQAIDQAIDQPRSNRPPVSKAKRNRVFDLFGNQCLSCNSYDDVCIDHVIPLSKGGNNTTDNMQPLCRSCNSLKGVSGRDFRPKQSALTAGAC